MKCVQNTHLVLDLDPVSLLNLRPQVHEGPPLLEAVQLIQDSHRADLVVCLPRRLVRDHEGDELLVERVHPLLVLALELLSQC